MKAATQKIPCGRCSGSGEVPLPYAHLVALQLVRKAKAVNAGQLHAMRIMHAQIGAGQRRSTTNNMLEELRRLGFVKRNVKKDGKWVYTPTK